jgi:RNA polymerase sigma factor (sigma-70 family)
LFLLFAGLQYRKAPHKFFEIIFLLTVFRIRAAAPSEGMVAENTQEILLETVASEMRPLTRRYEREPSVIAQVAEMRALPSPEFWRRVQFTDFQVKDCPRMESLVYFLREFMRAGDEDGSWRIVEALAGRVAREVTRRLSAWKSLASYQRDEAEEAIRTALFTEWRSLAPENEFWEVRFGTCLRRKIFDEIDRVSRVRSNETLLDYVGDDEGNKSDPWELIRDNMAESPETQAVIADALLRLPSEVRTAFVLYHYEDWTEESIAERLKVTSRTIRNYLRRAGEQLRRWRELET